MAQLSFSNIFGIRPEKIMHQVHLKTRSVSIEPLCEDEIPARLVEAHNQMLDYGYYALRNWQSKRAGLSFRKSNHRIDRGKSTARANVIVVSYRVDLSCFVNCVAREVN
jgi:hypothetical protein